MAGVAVPLHPVKHQYLITEKIAGLSPDADFDEVRKAWRTKAKEVHPDVKPGDAAAAEQFRKLQVSYEVLRAAEERRVWSG